MVTLNTSTQSLLAQLNKYLKTLYGNRLYKVMLFGSHARGEARPDSDIDVLVVLTGAVNPGQEIANISGFLADLSLEYGKVISCLFMDETRFTTRQGPLLRNIRREGIAV
ncbi:nucleotidyltransferase [filamentous cyanobacterium CCP3]|nr:nucleotidyltransferase [filamentous cyanobacterium CCP3]